MKKRILISLAIALLLVATVTLPAVAAIEPSTVASVTVSSALDITLTGDIDFANVSPGTTEASDVDQSSEITPAITINIATNELVDIGVKGAITTGSGLTLDNWEYSTSYAKAGISPLTTSYVEVYGDVDDTITPTKPVFHWITIPVGTPAGLHEVTVTYKVVTAGVPF